MRILMLGNSFTYYNDMPRLLAVLLDAEVVAHTRGGAYLVEHLDPESELGSQTLKALREEKWDYVILQEQSRAPIFEKEKFMDSVHKLCELIRSAGAKPVLYATWAYRDGSEKLKSTQLTHVQMLNGLCQSYSSAAEKEKVLIADAGKAFFEAKDIVDLYMQDDFHPSPAGSMLAAAVLARTIEAEHKK